jgi:hypothetical protein
MMTAEATSMWHRLWYTRWRDMLRGRIDGRLDWRAIVAAEDLPANVRTLVGDVVSRTRLWRREKVDVARELIAHFHDGLEAGASSEQLTSSFGDPRQAAQLIRRAKRRGRSPVWQIWHIACLAFGALLIAYVGFGAYYLTGRPTIKVDYMAFFNERAKSAPDEERAWPLYRQALGQLTVNREFPQWMNTADVSPTSTDWPKSVAWLKEHEAALSTLREATKRPELGFAVGVSPKSFPPADQKLFFDPTEDRLSPRAPKLDRIEDQMVISALLPHVLPMREAARVLKFDALRAAEAGDSETALADVLAILGIADHLQQMPCLIVTVTAGAVQGIAYSTVQEVLGRRPELWSAGQLRDLAHVIAGNKLDWQGGFEGEHAMFLDTMQRFYTDDGHGDGHLAFRGPEGLNVFDALTRFTGNNGDNPFAYDSLAAVAMPAANMVIASRKEMTDLYNEKHNEALLRMETPLWQLPKGRSYDPDFLTEHSNRVTKTRHLFVSLMQPAYDKLRNKVAEFDGNRDGVLIGIALAFYHREHKAWPKSLEELAPRWLPSVPLDQTTGKALGYKIVDDRPEVYNIGPSPLVEEEQPLNSLELPITKTIPSDSRWVIWSIAPKN